MAYTWQQRKVDDKVWGLGQQREVKSLRLVQWGVNTLLP
jgi:hypothetical protein